MKKLADISAFESLSGCSPVSDCSVLNVFTVPVEIEDWDDFKKFILANAPGDWKARRFEVIDALPYQAREDFFEYLNELYNSAGKLNEWYGPLERFKRDMDAYITELDQEYGDKYTREDILEIDGI